MNTIILGIFSGPYWREIKTATGADEYPFLREVLPQWLYNELPTVIDVVKAACERADSIVFLLDGIFLPLAHDVSVTCAELAHILSSPELLEKTVFYLNNRQAPTEEVLNVYKL